MITFPSQNQQFTVTFQGDAKGANEAWGFTRSRSMLRVKYEVPNPTMVLVDIYASLTGEATPHIKYYTTPDGVLEIPLKNLLNYAYDKGESSILLHLGMLQIGQVTIFDSLTFAIYLQNGISYYDLLSPKMKDEQPWVMGYQHTFVMPPNIMYNPRSGKGIIVESNFGTFGASQSMGLVWSEIAGGLASVITPTGGRSNQLPCAAGSDTLKVADSDYEKTWKLETMDFCTNCVVCRWTSQTGAVRQHYFPIMSFINAVDEELSIVEAGNGYDIRKNVYKGVRCRINGLTAYGYWYYQDMLMASDLHAVVLPTFTLWSTEIASMETAAYAEGDMSETPTGTGFFDFEFTIKLRHYDTF